METIEPMTRADLEMVLGWAAAEGWNPGRDDATAFHVADPDGFLLKRVDGQPAAAISVVNHNPGFAFLGLYIAAPGMRGHGHGWDVWKAGLAHAGTRTVGLDGVPAQEQNYARSGFARTGATTRYRGALLARGTVPLRPMTEDDLPSLLAQDARAQGFSRPGFAIPWLRGTATRHTMVGADEATYGTARDCREGRKIGPLCATTGAGARDLIGQFSNGQTVFVDVPDASPALASLLKSEGFVPVFETARMYLGAPPAPALPPYSAVATLELG